MYKSKDEYDFEFKVLFKRGNFNIKSYKWKIIDEKKVGRSVAVQGYGNDGQLYDGVASISATGVVKKIDVDSNSRRWE